VMFLIVIYSVQTSARWAPLEHLLSGSEYSGSTGACGAAPFPRTDVDCEIIFEVR